MLGYADMTAPLTTPGTVIDTSRDVIVGTQGVVVPPSPGFTNGFFDQTNLMPDSPTLPFHKHKALVISQDHTGSGIKKAGPKSKSRVWKFVNTTAGSTAALSGDAHKKPFHFLQLPGGR
jgi:hypothetical protein